MATSSAVKQWTTGSIDTLSESANPGLSATMQLMGIPYQFTEVVDPPTPGVSDILGRKFIDNIILSAPVVTIVPGKPVYLPGKTKDQKAFITNAMMSVANDMFAEIKQIRETDPELLRLYDFQPDYTTYFKYVNVLCRSCACFLELGKSSYRINGQPVNFSKFDWRNYRWTGKKYSSVANKIVNAAGKEIKSELKALKEKASKFITNATGGALNLSDPDSRASEEEIEIKENLLRQTNYIQFYVDPSSGSSMGVTNNTQQSAFKQALDQGSSAVKDIAFLANSGGIDATSLQQLGSSAINAIGGILGTNSSQSIDTTAGSIVQRLLSSGKAIIKGENVMMPDIWSGSTTNKNYDLIIHLRAPYGNTLCVYMDVIVPLMHLIALSFPLATTANTYQSPQLVKIHSKGNYTCSLGIVSNITINKAVDQMAKNPDGLVTAVDVTLSITDLYPDVALTPANDIHLFANNSPLIEYLANTCGLDMVESQWSKKSKLFWNSKINMVSEIPTTVMGNIGEEIDGMIAKWTQL